MQGGETGAAVERALWALRAYDTTALATVSESGPHVAGVFFAPEIEDGRIRLLLAVLDGSRKALDIAEDPRVAFMCSPGNPSRWIQGSGSAERAGGDEPARLELFRRLVAHAPGAQQFVDNLPVHPFIVEVRELKVVEALGKPPLRMKFD
ncbi:MAG: pyridoxamine 5'-phosphate oxidase family protein [Candidatus Dormibacteraeota bacterium]|nr:pyridoxamine 5'-phosphate oxidase family protein [Candidatus Dormibacteraeota bacterium]